MRLPHPAIRRSAHRLTRDGILRPLPDRALRRNGDAEWHRWGSLRERDSVLEAGEIYLELIELDLEAEDAILTFVNRWGPLAISYGADYRLLPPLPGFREAKQQLAQSRPPKKGPPKRQGFPPVPRDETLAEFRFGARCIRDLTRAWQHLKDGTEAQPTPRSSFQADTAPDTQADHFLQVMLNRGLSPFQPYIQLHPLPTSASRVPPTPRSPWVAGTVPLYATCCLELYNHIVDHASYLICSNEKCGRTFVRQTGRAEHSQYRSRGLKYCSRECARAQAQRALRARRRAQQPPPDPTTQNKAY